jgi:hypothetical protein
MDMFPFSSNRAVVSLSVIGSARVIILVPSQVFNSFINSSNPQV